MEKQRCKAQKNDGSQCNNYCKSNKNTCGIYSHIKQGSLYGGWGGPSTALSKKKNKNNYMNGGWGGPVSDFLAGIFKTKPSINKNNIS